MQFDSVRAALITIAFLVPGFVWSTILSMMIPRRSRATDLRILEFLTLTFINHGLWCWAWALTLRQSFLENHPQIAASVGFLLVFVSPAALGLLTGSLARTTLIARFLARLGYQPLRAIPTAWDYFFGRGQLYWVVAILKDGSRVYGLYGLESFAGDEPGQRDLYLEALFRPNEHGEWVPVEDSAGVLIASEQIAVLEVRKLTEIEYGEQDQSATQ